MKRKTVIQLSVDILMTLALLFLMGYHLWGEALHEWVGAGMLLLFIAHHILNGHWHKSLFKGKYNATRILTLCIDIPALISMLVQMYSGIAMSRYLFDFLPSMGGMSLARRLHILGAYWGYILMSLHLGLHWNMILAMFRKAAGIKSKSKIRSIIAFMAGLIIWGFAYFWLITAKKYSEDSKRNHRSRGFPYYKAKPRLPAFGPACREFHIRNLNVRGANL